MFHYINNKFLLRANIIIIVPMITSILCYVTMATTLDATATTTIDDKIMYISYRIKEELPNGTLISNLFKDVIELYKRFKLTAISTLYSVKQMRKFELNTYDTDMKYMNQFFKLDQDTGNLFIRKSIDYETICPTLSTSTALSPSSITTDNFSSLKSKVYTKSNHDCIIKLILFVSLNNSIDERWIPIIVYIDDVNDNRPVFLEVNSTKWSGFFHIPIEENTPVGTRLPLVKAFDADTDMKNSEIVYKLQFDGPELFGLTTTATTTTAAGCSNEVTSQGDKKMTNSPRNMNNLPCLIVKANLDYETEPKNYFLQLLACESGFLHSECSSLPIKIELIDKNDNAPKIIFPPNSYHVVNISENLPIDSVILKIQAIDADSGENSRLTYTLTQNLFQKGLFTNSNHGNNYSTHGANDQYNQFTIDPENGEIRLAKVLNAYETSQIEITYHVSDNGSPPVHKISQKILFNILDVNNHAPSIEIKKVGCSKFTQRTNEIQVAYTIESGSHLGFIIVSDSDLGKNGHVSCTHRLENYNDNWSKRYLNIFKINLVNNGQISNRYLYTLQIMRVDDEDNLNGKNSMSKSMTASAIIVITCKDHGVPLALTSSTSITITLTDVQETELCFEQASYQVTVEESNHPMINLLRPQLLDLVSGVRYSLHAKDDPFSVIDSSNGCDQLEIDPTTGEISAPNGIDREKSAYISCIIKATEQRVLTEAGGEVQQHRTATAEILLNITDINDNEPRLIGEALLYGFTIYEWDIYASSSSNNHDYDDVVDAEDNDSHVIGYLNAIDQDFGENGTVKYFLLQVTPEKNQKSIEMRQILNNEIINISTINIANYRSINNPRVKPAFRIDSNSGVISLPKSSHRLINWEDVSIYTLQILIEDMGSPKKLTSVQDIKIYVTDINDNSPIWLQAINVNRIHGTTTANKVILLYQLEPIWEVNQNSPTELRSMLKAIDFDYGDNARLEMSIIQPNSIYKEFIGMNKLPLPINSLRLSPHGELHLDIDRLKENYEYGVFVRVQDQGVQRQLYTDAYFLLRLPIQTRNRLELFTNSINHPLNQSISNYKMKIMNKNQSSLSTSPSSLLLFDKIDNSKFTGGLSKKGIIIILIISITSIIILSIIIIFIIIFKIRKFKNQKIQTNYHNNHNRNNSGNNVYINDNQIMMPNELILPQENQYLYHPVENLNDCSNNQLILSNNLNFTSPTSATTTCTNATVTTNDFYKYYNDETNKKYGIQLRKSYRSHIPSSCDIRVPNVYTNLMSSYTSNHTDNQLSASYTTDNTTNNPIYSNSNDNYYYYQKYNDICQTDVLSTPVALKNRYGMPSPHYYHQSDLPPTDGGTLDKIPRMTITTEDNNSNTLSINPVSIRHNYNQTLPRQF